MTPAERRVQELESAQERRSEEEWIRYLARPESFFGKRPDKREATIFKGIPDGMRSRVWQLLLDPTFGDPERPRRSVAAMVEQGDPPCCATIRVDLRRTLPRVAMFAETAVQDSLRRVLHAYANVDSECGYCQGMGYVAAMFLTYMSEEPAFWCFRELMFGGRCKLRQLYIANFENLGLLSRVWEVLLESRYRRVYRNFQKLQILPALYTTPWFLTGFMGVDFRPEVRLKIFDRFVAFGFRALLSFGLVIISRHKDDLATRPLGTCLPFLHKPEQSPRMTQNWRYVSTKFDKLWVSEKEYVACFKKAQVPLFP